MYLNLYKALKNEQISLSKLSSLLDTDDCEVKEKLHGEIEFTKKECDLIRRILPEYSVDWLFQCTED